LKLDKYYGAGIAAFVIWGFIPFPLKALAAYPSGQILYFRVLFSVVLLLAIMLIFRQKSIRHTYNNFKAAAPAEKRKFLILTALGGALLTVNWFIFIYVINHIDIQTGSFSYLLCPILTALLGYLLLSEKIKKNQWVAIFISLLSCFMLGTGSLVNLFYSLFIAASYAFYLITQRVLKDYDKMVLLTLQLMVSFSLMGPFYNYFNAGHTLGTDYYFFGVIAVLSVGFTIIPLFLNLYALTELKSGTIGILMYINPIINFMMAFLYFQEQSSLHKGMAYSLIFLSVILYNLKFKKKKRLKPAYSSGKNSNP
jgi:chloramphenicol-sensitive protein RarD